MVAVAVSDAGGALNTRRTSTKNSGTKNTPSTVALIMPPKTLVPMAFWLPEPAPWLIASGNTPNMKASDVIKWNWAAT